MFSGLMDPIRIHLNPTAVGFLFDFLSFKNYVNVPSKSNKQKNLFFISFLFSNLKSITKNSRIRIRINLSEA
jgi:hypothetical protein